MRATATHALDPSAPARLRLAIVDDSPFVRAPDGSVHPRSAVFHRFAAAVVRCGPFAPADYLVPVSDARPTEPRLEAVDPRWLRVVPTAPFDGAAGYLARWPLMLARNAPPMARAIGRADLVWIKAPASNALLAAALCRASGVSRFTYIVGSARDVVAGQRRSGPETLAAALAAALYDTVSAALARSGPSRTLDAEVFTSTVTDSDVRATLHGEPAERSATGGAGRRSQLVWAGRVAGEKGLDDLLRALALLGDRGRRPHLTLLGVGPARPGLERLATALGVAGQVRWAGLVADRERYFAELRAADLFVFPSRAEGVPKAVVEAMAAGLPVVGTSAGATAELLGHGERGVVVAPGSPSALADAIDAMLERPAVRESLARAGVDWAAGRTAEAQARRLIELWRRSFPELAWPDDRA